MIGYGRIWQVRSRTLSISSLLRGSTSISVTSVTSEWGHAKVRKTGDGLGRYLVNTEEMNEPRAKPMAH